VPATEVAREYIHDNRETDKLESQTNTRDVRDPHLIWFSDLELADYVRKSPETPVILGKNSQEYG